MGCAMCVEGVHVTEMCVNLSRIETGSLSDVN